MERIRELIQALEGKFIDKVPVFELITTRKAKKEEDLTLGYLQLLRENPNITEKEIITTLYQDREGCMDSYRKLEKRLRGKLYELYFLLNPADYTKKKSAQSTIKNLKGGLLSKILVFNDTYHAATYVARKTLQNALKNFDFESAIILCSILRKIHGLQGNKTETNYYNRKLLYCIESLKAESEAEAFFHELNILASKSTIPGKKLMNLSERAKNTIGKSNAKYQTLKLNQYHFRVSATHFEIKEMFQELLQLCKEREEYITLHKEFSEEGDLRETTLHAINSLLCLGQSDAAVQMARKNVGYFKLGSYNWFTLKEVEFLSLMHQEQFKPASKSIEEALHNNRFVYLPQNVQERWRLYNAFIYEVLPEVKSLIYLFDKEHKISDLFDGVYATDKKGMNTTFIILQVYHYIRINDFEQAYIRAENARVYALRYLKDRTSKRSRLFIHMLVTLSKNKFNLSLSEPFTKVYLKKLQNTAKSKKAVVEGIEIIPFEKLWLRIVDKLKDSKQKT